MGVRVRGPAVFAGFRVIASNGINLPVFNVFRMFSRMGADRMPAVSDGAVDLDAMMKEGVRGKPDVGALASRDAKVTVWPGTITTTTSPDLMPASRWRSTGSA